MRTRRTITFLGALAIAAGTLTATTTILPAAAQDGKLKLAAKGELPIPHITVPATASNGAKAQAATTIERAVPTLSGSIVTSAKAALGGPDNQDTAGDTGTPSGTTAGPAGSGQVPQVGADSGGADKNALGVAPKTLGCSQRDGSGGASNNGDTKGNVRVNQDCTFRRQAEEIIKFNPADPNNLIAGQNDSRIGYNHCGFDYSFNAGKTWGDGLPPFWQHTNNPASQEAGLGDPNRHTIGGGPGTLHTYDAASDPILAFDSAGRAFFGCVVFDINSNANGLIVTQSPAGAGGSFYDNVPDVAVDAAGNPRPGVGRRFIVAEDNNGAVVHDKPFLTADAYPNSRNRDNLYVTWTVFKFDPRCVAGGTQCESPIFGSMSTDHGLTWSTPEEISGTSDALCFFGNILDPTLPFNSCNLDQGSDPIVLPNGDLQVIFNNGNTGPGIPNAQQLGVHCAPSGSSPAGTAHLNCAAPSKVGNDVVVGEPVCNFGRGPEECIPGAYIRTNDFPRIAVNRGNGHLYATWQDYRNGEFDTQLSQSLDGGLTWTEATAPVNPDKGKDHYFPAIDVVPSGSPTEKGKAGSDESSNASDHVAVSYYRTDRVPNETEQLTCFVGGIPNNCTVFAPGVQPGAGAESSDYDLSGGRGLNTPYTAERISPRFAPPDGNQTGFNGDYSGLTVVGEVAHPVWSDTRNVVPAQFQAQPPGQGTIHDEDVFTVTRGVPDGHGEQIGD